MYNRILNNIIIKRANKGKAIIVIGPRQAGKTTLLKTILNSTDYLSLDADNPIVRDTLTNPNTEQLKTIIGKHKIVFIDEAQRIENIGITLKIITDQFTEIQLYVSGSSSFDLQNVLTEPLTGRKWEFELFPVSWEEYEEKHGFLHAEQNIENRIVFGFYPDVLNNTGDEKIILKQLVNSYLYKDVLSLSGIRKPYILEKLVKALAFQIGSEVSYNELSQIVGVDKNTISKYILLLEQAFIVFRLPAYSRNLRNEIKHNQKIYFYDTGIRNAVIGNFTPFSSRIDKGALWENFLIAERLKQNKYKDTFAQMYFWRTKQQQEVDFVEEIDNKLIGFEFKWIARSNTTLPRTFVNTYKAETMIVDKSNFRKFVVI